MRKPVYQAVSKEVAEEALLALDEKWGKLYPIVLQSWNNKWENLSVYFKYPPEIRKVIYTTNIIESVHRQFRKLTKTKGAFPNENSLLKLLYMGMKNATKKWNMPMWNWNLTLSQLAIFFLTESASTRKVDWIVNLKFKFGCDRISPIRITLTRNI